MINKKRTPHVTKYKVDKVHFFMKAFWGCRIFSPIWVSKLLSISKTACLSSAESSVDVSIVWKKKKKWSKNKYRVPAALGPRSAVLQFSTALARTAFFSPRCVRACFAASLRQLVLNIHTTTPLVIGVHQPWAYFARTNFCAFSLYLHENKSKCAKAFPRKN